MVSSGALQPEYVLRFWDKSMLLSSTLRFQTDLSQTAATMSFIVLS